MRCNLMRLLTLALAGLLCLTPFAAAGDAHLDADAATDEASTGLGLDAEHADAADVAEAPEGFWAKVGVRFSAFVERIGAVLGLAGQDAPDLSGDADVSLGAEGVDVEGTLAGVPLPDVAVGPGSLHASAQASGVGADLSATVTGTLPSLG